MEDNDLCFWWAEEVGAKVGKAQTLVHKASGTFDESGTHMTKGHEYVKALWWEYSGMMGASHDTDEYQYNRGNTQWLLLASS